LFYTISTYTLCLFTIVLFTIIYMTWYLTTLNGNNTLFVLMCCKAVNQSISISTELIHYVVKWILEFEWLIIICCLLSSGNIRNLAMEKVASSVMFPCRYVTNGCNATMPHTDKTSHEDGCEFRLPRWRSLLFYTWFHNYSKCIL